jgi:hypothetical protein
MRSEVTNVINAVGELVGSIPMRQSNFASLMMLFRIKECMISIELLVSKGLIRDAASLLLEMIKFRLEMEYIAANPINADAWIRSKKDNTRPWKTSFLIDQLCRNDKDRKWEYDNYGFFQKLMHSDPMENQPDFPINEDDATTAVKEDLALCLYSEGSECYKILNAVITDFAGSGFDIKTNPCRKKNRAASPDAISRMHK